MISEAEVQNLIELISYGSINRGRIVNTLGGLLKERDHFRAKAAENDTDLAGSAIDAIRNVLGEDGKIAFIDDAVATALKRRDDRIAELERLLKEATP